MKTAVISKPQKNGGAQADRSHTAKSSPQNGGKPSSPLDNGKPVMPALNQTKAAIANLQALMERAVAASGCEDIAAFKRLPPQEQKAFLAQAEGAASVGEKAHQAATAATTSVPPANEPRRLPIAQIERSPFNRDIASEAAAAGEAWMEFCGSIREHGIIQPLIVRQLAIGRYEIIAGERRWQAAKAVGLAEVPVVVRAGLSDNEAIELQLIENLQRADLKPMDEARGYQLLRERGCSVEDIATKTNVARSVVFARLALLKLPESARAAVESGRIPASHAEEIGKIKDPAAMQKIVKEILNPQSWNMEEGEKILSFRATRQLVKKENEEAAGREEYAREKSEFEKQGFEILDDDECAKIWPYGSSSLNHPYSKKWQRLEDHCDTLKSGAWERWEKLIPKKQLPSPILGHTMSGKPVIVYPRAELLAKLKELMPNALKSDAGDEKAAARKKREKAQIRRAAWRRILDKIVDAVENGGDTDKLLRLIAADYLGRLACSTARVDEIVQRRGLDTKMGSKRILDLRIESGFGRSELRGLIVEAITWQHVPIEFGEGTWSEGLQKVCAIWGLDPKAIEEEVRTSGGGK